MSRPALSAGQFHGAVSNYEGTAGDRTHITGVRMA
jgi:hypothetical protein